MSSLNLHLDFMNEPEQPIRYVELSAEEELQIMEDSTKLLKQIDEDCRVLDGMCSALENLIIIKNHYDEFGSSPALEALVGDIKEYLGISTEADEETGSDAGDGGEQKSGIGGVFEKVWNWIINLFQRIGEWLNLTDKIVENNHIKENINLDPASNHDINVSKILYADGAIVDKFSDIKDLVQKAIKCVEKSIDVTISINGNETQSSSTLTEWSSALEKCTNLCTPVQQQVKGNQIKDLNHRAYELYKQVKPVINDLDSRVKSLSEKLNSKKKKSSRMRRETAESMDLLKKTIQVLTKCLQSCTGITKFTKKIAYPNAAKADEEAAKKKQEKTQEQKPQENKQQEQKPEEKK